MAFKRIIRRFSTLAADGMIMLTLRSYETLDGHPARGCELVGWEVGLAAPAGRAAGHACCRADSTPFEYSAPEAGESGR